MTDISVNLILNFLIFLTIPFICAYIAKRLKISTLIGYIVGGLLLGNLFSHLFAKNLVNNFAYFGIILLLFTLGLEVNFERIIALKKFIIIGGLLQVIISSLFIAILSKLFGFTVLKSFLIGIALSSSSTTLVAKIIQDRGEENSFVGEIALGILMFQNIAFIPFLIIFTSISQGSNSFFEVTSEIVVSLIESGLLILVLYYLGQKIIPLIFDKIARTSRELLNLFIIVFIFLITYLSLVLKIPIFIGVFVAGIMVAQTSEHYHIFSQVRPMRDLLAVIFFIFIGLNIQLGIIAFSIPNILLFSFFVVIIKFLIILIVFLTLKFHSKTAFSLALYLFQIDEDAFILMSAALVNKIVTKEEYLFIISSILFTLVITPLLIQKKNILYALIRDTIKKLFPFIDIFIKHRIDRDQSPIDVLNIKNHIVICGYGRVGRYIGRSLMLANIPFVAIDYNFHAVEKAKKEGVNIIYGDPTDIDILDYAQVDEALILILAIPEKFDQETIILRAKKLNSKIYIISRIHREGDQRRMKDLGVDLVVHPEFEASLSIIKKIYLWNKISKEDAFNKIKRLKIEHGLA